MLAQDTLDCKSKWPFDHYVLELKVQELSEKGRPISVDKTFASEIRDKKQLRRTWKRHSMKQGPLQLATLGT
jgi:hypothetical protein